MKVSRVTVRQILGQESFDFRPAESGLTILRGRNSSGKSSILEAIKALLAGGTDATLLRQGSTEGEVVLLLDEGIELRESLRRRAGEDGQPGGVEASYRVTHPQLGRLKSPRQYIEKLIRGESYNPVAFLDAPPAERVRMLLSAVGTKLPPEERARFQAAATLLGDEGTTTENLFDLPALQATDQLEAKLFDARTSVNRLAAEKQKMLVELCKATADVHDVDAARAELEAATAAMEAERRDAEKQFNNNELVHRSACEMRTAARDTAQEDSYQAITTGAKAAEEKKDCEITAMLVRIQDAGRILEGLQQAHSKLRSDRAAIRDVMVGDQQEVRKEYERALTEEHARIKEERDVQREVIRAATGPRIRAALDAEAGAKLRLEEAVRASGLLELAEGARKEADEAEARAADLTMAIDGVRALREKVLAHCPVRGIDVRTDGLHLDGVPFDRASESRRIEAAVDLAIATAGELKMCIVDGLERLDPERLEEFRVRVEAAGLQCICATVDEGALRVERGD